MRHRRRSRALLTTAGLVAASLLAGAATATAVPTTDRPTPTFRSPFTASAPTSGATDRDDTVPYTPPALPPQPSDLARATTSTQNHVLDLVVVNPSASVASTATDADVRALVADVSAYWSAQTAGRVTFSVKTIKRVNAAASTPSCTQDDGITTLWSQASKAVSGKDWYPASGTPTAGPGALEHLVVLYPYANGDAGQTTCNGLLGLGTITTTPTLAARGLTFALFGGRQATTTARAADPQFYGARATLAHELGHNFGLQHSGTWWCLPDGSGKPVVRDQAIAGTSIDCNFINYEDPMDLMGANFGAQGIPALSGPQKTRLGVLTGGQVRTVTGTTTLVTIAAVPATETGASTSVAQVAKVKDPSTGDTYYVEYRPTNVGLTWPDPALDPLSPTSGITLGDSLYQEGAGVRILRFAPSTHHSSLSGWSWDQNEQAIVPVTTDPHLGYGDASLSYLPAGKSFTTRSGKVTITVGAESSTAATVSFKVPAKPSLTIKRSASSQRYAQTSAKVTATLGTVEGKRPTGTLTFKDGTKTVRTVKVAAATTAGSASYSLPKTSKIGTHSISVSFAPDSAAKARDILSATTVKTSVAVTKATTSSVSVKLSPTSVKKGKTSKLTVTLHVTGISKPTGKVAIYENGKKIKTVSVTSSKKGKFTYTLPKTTKKGTVKVQAKYLGSSTTTARNSATIKLKVT